VADNPGYEQQGDGSVTWKDILTSKLETPTDPLWRVSAYWLVIITVFTLPIVVWIADIPSKWNAEEFRYLWRFHDFLIGLLAGMMGLNSWDRHLVAKNGQSVEKKQEEVSNAAETRQVALHR
jgi:hypothetical protein